MRFIFFRFIAQNCLAIAFKCNPLGNRHHRFQPISSTFAVAYTHTPKVREHIWKCVTNGVPRALTTRALSFAFSHSLSHLFASISICVYVFHMQFPNGFQTIRYAIFLTLVTNFMRMVSYACFTLFVFCIVLFGFSLIRFLDLHRKTIETKKHLLENRRHQTITMRK